MRPSFGAMDTGLAFPWLKLIGSTAGTWLGLAQVKERLNTVEDMQPLCL